MEIGKDKERLARAKEKLVRIKGFYTHMTIYIIMNLAVTANVIYQRMQGGESFWDTMDFWTFTVWFFWGIGLFFHGMRAFGKNPIFSKEWEAKQIEKIMKADKKTG